MMVQCFLTLAAFVVQPLVSQGAEDSQSLDSDIVPLIAPKPLIPPEQIDGPLPDDYVIARLDGKPIRLVELFERHGYLKRLKQYQAVKTSGEYRSIQEDLLNSELRRYITERVFVREPKRQLSKEQYQDVNRRVEELWQDSIKRLQAEFEINSIEALERVVLDETGSPLSTLRRSFYYKEMSIEYVAWRNERIAATEDSFEVISTLGDKLLEEADLQTVIDIPQK